MRFCEPENLVNGDTGADEGFFGDCLNYYYLMQWRMRKSNVYLHMGKIVLKACGLMPNLHGSFEVDV